MEKIWLKHYDKGVPEEIEIPDISLPEFLKEQANFVPQNTLIEFFGNEITFREVDKSSDNFALNLLKEDFKKGDRVALLLPNCPQYLISFYGILKAGGIVVPCNPLYTVSELTWQLRNAGAKFLVVPDFKELFLKACKLLEVTELKKLIFCRFGELLPFPKDILFSLLKRKDLVKKNLVKELKREEKLLEFEEMISQKKEERLPKISPEETAILVYTGGTTGVPKGTCLTHKNLVANSYQCKSWLPKYEYGRESFLTVLPLFHSYALTTCLNWAISIGSRVILIPRYDPEQLLKAIDKSKPTLFMGVPAMFKAIAEHPKVKRFNLSSIKYCISGAAPLPKEVQENFEKITNCKLVEGYGLTEASPVTHCNPFLGRQKGIGIPLPSTEAKIVDLETGEKELEIAKEGELCIKGPQVMKEYWQNPQETKEVLRDGWLYTGDVARVDKEGYFEIVDRKKDIIIVQKTKYLTGHNVYPNEVESVILKLPGVKEVAVIGIPDPETGERVKAFVVLEERAALSEKDIIEFCKKNLTEYKIPSEIEFRKELPKNFLGKVLRKNLRNQK